MDQIVENAAASLERLANAVVTSYGNDQRLSDSWGWSALAATRHELGRLATDLATDIRRLNTGDLDSDLRQFMTNLPDRVGWVQGNVVPNLYNGNSPAAGSAYVNFLMAIGETSRRCLKHPTDWEAIESNEEVPAELRKRMRGYKAILDRLSVDETDISNKLATIQEAVTASEAMPSDLRELEKARVSMEQSVEVANNIKATLQQIEKDAKTSLSLTTESQDEAQRLVGQCSEAYRITTTVGLAAAFDKRATQLTQSMWIWVLGLLISLAAGAYLGADRLHVLTMILEGNTSSANVFLNILVSLLSVGGPLWFAWLATKQIGQRFRLSEDYAFKASVAKAYEGYRREAARIDEDFEKRLFGSALTRLEEAPLRLVESSSFGSPLHELIESRAFDKALDMVPDLYATMKGIAGMPKSAIKRAAKRNHVDAGAEAPAE